MSGAANEPLVSSQDGICTCWWTRDQKRVWCRHCQTSTADCHPHVSGGDDAAAAPTEADRLRGRVEDWAAQVAAVRALHTRKYGNCDECCTRYPCKTLRAMGDER